MDNAQTSMLATQADLSPQENRKVVLCIDDDPGILGALERVLRRGPHRIVTASDPEEGLRLALTLKPNLILVDMMMPAMTGKELLGKLREQSGTVQAVLLTGRDIDGTEANDPTLAGVHYMRKPFQNKEVRELVERLLGNGKQDPS